MTAKPAHYAVLIAALVAAANTPAAGDKPAVHFEPVSYKDWQHKLAAYPPDIVVVDLWATWCVSCIERFPKMVDLYRRYKDRGVRFVSLNLDDHRDRDALDGARRFLVRQQAVFENYWLDENMMRAFKELDLVGIPAVIIYGRKGTERYRLTGDNPNRQFGDKDVENAIIELLQKQPQHPNHGASS